jgi:2-dehydro-3-deoxygluconokinase
MLIARPNSWIPAAASGSHDLVALGECMLRLSPPGAGRIEFARSFDIDVGGGEYNVAYAAARLGLRAAFLSKLPDNPLAAIILNHARAAGVDVRHVALETHDGVGRANRVGLYFAEIGAGVRGGMALFDRGHSSASQMRPSDVNWDQLFARERVRWLHTGGIFAVLSDSTRQTMRAALTAAAASRTVVSYDLNYRPALSSAAEAAVINRDFVSQADVVFGSPEGFRTLVPGLGPNATDEQLALGMAARFPQLRVIAGTRRQVQSASRHDLGGFLWVQGQLTIGREFRDLEVIDRVGTGDAFAAGIAAGLLQDWPAARTVDFALAHAALVHTTRGDTSQFSIADISELAAGADASMRR